MSLFPSSPNEPLHDDEDEESMESISEEENAPEPAHRNSEPLDRAAPLDHAEEAPLSSLLMATQLLQDHENALEVKERMQAASEEEKERRVRKARWEEVKARMSQRNTPMPSIRSREWDEEDDSERVTASGVLCSSQDPLMDNHNRPLQRMTKRAVVSWPEKVWHFVYNWIRYFTFAASFFPGVNLYDANKPEGYYRREEYD